MQVFNLTKRKKKTYCIFSGCVRHYSFIFLLVNKAQWNRISNAEYPAHGVLLPRIQRLHFVCVVELIKPILRYLEYRALTFDQT